MEYLPNYSTIVIYRLIIQIIVFRSTLSEGNSINSVGLDKVYVIATGSSASASEMIINSLKSYIDVVQIGTETVGKSQASITLYDSPNFQRQGANPGHLYALQRW